MLNKKFGFNFICLYFFETISDFYLCFVLVSFSIFLKISLQVEALELRDFRPRQHLIGCDYVTFHRAVHKSPAQRFLFHE